MKIIQTLTAGITKRAWCKITTGVTDDGAGYVYV